MKAYMYVAPLVVSKSDMMIAMVKVVSSTFNPYGISWLDFREVIDLAECEELPGKRKRIAVAVVPLSFHESIEFDVVGYNGVLVGTRVYHGGKEYRSEYVTSPVVIFSGDTLNLMLHLDED